MATTGIAHYLDMHDLGTRAFEADSFYYDRAIDLIKRSLALLRDGKPARFVERKPEEERTFQQLNLLTAKPVLYVCNVDEGDAAEGDLHRRPADAGAASPRQSRAISEPAWPQMTAI